MSLEKDFIITIQHHSGIINSICGNYFPKSDDFKDARQDVILQLWRSFPTFRGGSKISTWIYKVALNTILAKRKKDYKLGANEPISQAHLDQISSGADLTMDDIQEFSWLISKLDDCDKAIVMLLMEGYLNKEIAVILDLTATSISTRVNRLKHKLKNRYLNEYH
ncbi:RNA polymerase sigma factor [Dyadobacter sp. CY323]|uniref:RNA polymerase sigma factor n=1 Tax=Dyadobacter sp. CY323 TaxID=2907302 RepID=UPI001F182DEC|nr:sigma-70 family RNA polymerase sigma factor [Dyadobacter sp. CY323]MCE6992790.1 sigma-70 family RNA polymerase sigma factor [Dyadobacter sp. CY323]